MTSPKWTSIVNRQASTTQHGHKNATQKQFVKRHSPKTSQNAPHLAGAAGAGAGHGRRSTGTRRLGCGRLGRGRGGRRRSGLSDKEWKEAKVAVLRFSSEIALRFFLVFSGRSAFCFSALDSKSLLLAVQFFSSFQRDGVEANKGKWILFIILSSFCTFHFIGCNITCLFKLACR